MGTAFRSKNCLGIVRSFPQSTGFRGRQRSLDCQRRLPRYVPCAPSSQLRNWSKNNLNNMGNLKIYHSIWWNVSFSGLLESLPEVFCFLPWSWGLLPFARLVIHLLPHAE